MATVSSAPLLPREHGAWGIVAIPFLTAVAIAGRLSLPVLLTALAVVLAFVARYPLELLAIPNSHLRAGRPNRGRLVRSTWIFSLLTLALGIVLTVVWRLHLLWGLALAGLILFALRVWWGRRGGDRSLTAELAGTAGLTLSALAGWIAATGTLDRTAFQVWGLNALFFGSGVLYVKSRILARRAQPRPEDQRSASFAVTFHFLILAFVVALVFARWLSPLIAIPFALSAMRAVHGVRAAAETPLALRRLGWSEVALSLVFAAFITLGFR